MYRNVEPDVRGLYGSDHLPTVDAVVDPSNVAKDTYQHILRDILEDMRLSDFKEMRKRIASLSDLAYRATVSYASKADGVYSSDFDNTGERILSGVPSVLYTLDKFSSYDPNSQEAWVYVEGIKVPKEDYLIRAFQGSTRLYVKESWISDGSTVHVEIRKTAKPDSRFQHSYPGQTSANGYSFTVPLHKVGDRSTSLTHLALFKKTSGASSYGPADRSQYSISFADFSMQNLQVTVSGQSSPGDVFLLVNKKSKDRLLKVGPQAGTLQLVKAVGNENYPLPIEFEEEARVFENGKLLSPGKDYDFVQGSPVVLSFKRAVTGNVEVLPAGPRGLPLTRSFFSDTLPSHGMVDTGFSFPCVSSYVEAYLGGKRIPDGKITMVSGRILRIDDPDSFDDIAVYASVSDSEAIQDIVKRYAEASNGLEKFIDFIGPDEYIRRLAGGANQDAFDFYAPFSDSHYWDLDQVADPKEFKITVPQDSLRSSISAIVAANPNRVKSIMKRISVARYETEIDIESKAKLQKANDIVHPNSTLSIGEQVVVCDLQGFGLRGEDSYALHVFVNGLKVNPKRYVVHHSTNSVQVYVDASKIADGDSVFFSAEVACWGKGYYKFLYEAAIPAESSHDFSIDVSEVGGRYYNPEDFLLLAKGSRDNFYKPVTGSEHSISVDETTKKVTVSISGSLTQSNQKFMLMNCCTTYRKVIELNETDNTSYLEENPLVSVDLFDMVGGERIPLPIKKSSDLRVWCGGILLIEGVDYDFYWNYGNDYAATRIFLRGVPKIGGNFLEIYSNGTSHEEVFESKNISSIPQDGIVGVMFTGPVTYDTVEAYLNRKRIHPSQIDFLTKKIIRVKGVSSTGRLDIRTRFPRIDLTEEAMAVFSNDPGDFTRYAEDIGMANFSQKYTQTHQIEPIDPTEPDRSLDMIPSTEGLSYYEIFIDRWYEGALDANEMILVTKYFNTDFVCNANVISPFVGDRNVVDANDTTVIPKNFYNLN